MVNIHAAFTYFRNMKAKSPKTQSQLGTVPSTQAPRFGTSASTAEPTPRQCSWATSRSRPDAFNRRPAIATLGVAMALTLGVSFASAQPIRNFGYGSLDRVAVSPDGQHLLTGGSQGLFLWNMGTGDVIRRFEAGPGRVARIGFNLDGSRLAVWSLDTDTIVHSLVVWKTTGELLHHLQAPRSGWGLEFGAQPLRFSADNTEVMIPRYCWNLVSGELREIHSGLPPDGSISAEISNGMLLVTDAASGERIQAIPLPRRLNDWAIFLSPDSQKIAAEVINDDGSGYREVRIWEIQSGQLLSSVPLPPRPHVVSFAGFNHDGTAILRTSGEMAELRRVSGGDVIQTFEGHTGEHIASIDFSSDGKRLLTSGSTFGGLGLVKLWDLQAGKHLQTVLREQIADGGDPVHASFSPSRNQVLVTIPHNFSGPAEYDLPTATRLFDLDTGAIRTLQRRPANGTAESRGAAAVFTSNGDLVVTAEDVWYLAQSDPPFQPVGVWSAETGELLRTLGTAQVPGEQLARTGLCLSPDDQLLLTTHYVLTPNSTDPNEHQFIARVWDFASGHLLHEIVRPERVWPWDTGMALTCDGLLVVAAAGWNEAGLAECSVEIWDVQSGQQVRQFKVTLSPSVRPMGLSASLIGHVVIIAGHVLDLETGSVLRVLQPEVAWCAAAFAPQPGLLMTGGAGGELSLWDIRDLIARPRYRSTPNGAQIHWDLGTLQFAPSVSGPWSDLPAASPMPLSTIGEHGFFRAKVEE
jgi:WD40 repeat protein